MDASGRTVLEPGGNKASAKQLFGKEELAAIMRCGWGQKIGRGLQRGP
jgi:hypothetical protein